MTERFSASAAPRLMQCAASGNLDTAIPGWTAPVVDHTAGAKGKGSEIHKIFEQAANYSAKDMQAIASAMTYVANLRATRRFKVLTEATTTADWLDSKPLTTVDLVLYTQDELHILDYKTGRIRVEVLDNQQLLYYAACFAHLAPKAKGVTVHIVQPWANNIASWFADTNVLRQFIDDARATEQKLLNKVPDFQPGNHCTFCPANPHSRGDKGSPLCPAMMQLLYPTWVDEKEMLDG